eukprot:scpid36639/ scgid14042/ 
MVSLHFRGASATASTWSMVCSAPLQLPASNTTHARLAKLATRQRNAAKHTGDLIMEHLRCRRKPKNYDSFQSCNAESKDIPRSSWPKLLSKHKSCLTGCRFTNY